MKILGNSLYCITSEDFSSGRNTLEVVKLMLESGVKLLQYREKEKTKKQKYFDCLKIREMTKHVGATFIVNDEVDIAMAVGADGVHIGQDDLPIEAVRSLTGNDFIIGVSTHSAIQAQEAVTKGADYIGVGPIYATQTKKGGCSPVGLEYLDYVYRNINIPFVAIGGIKAHNLTQVLKHGAKCVALVTEITAAPDIKEKIKEIKSIIESYQHDYSV